VTVRVSDNAEPPLSDAKALTVFGSRVPISATTMIGRTDRLEDSLSAPAWTPLGNSTVATSSSRVFTGSIGGNVQRFYRVVQMEKPEHERPPAAADSVREC
jgi:hypothetical protein